MIMGNYAARCSKNGEIFTDSNIDQLQVSAENCLPPVQVFWYDLSLLKSLILEEGMVN